MPRKDHSRRGQLATLGDKTMTQFITVRKKDLDNKTWQSVTRRKEIYARCSLENSLIYNSYVEDNIIRECNMENFEWRSTTLDNFVIDRSFAPNMQFSDDCDISGLKIYDSVIDGTNFISTVVESSKIETPKSAIRMSFIDCRMKNVAFLKADMRGALFSNCEFDGMVFNEVGMEMSVFANCSFKNCAFVKTSLIGCLVGCCQGFESSKFIKIQKGIQLHDKKQVGKASEGLIESSLSLEFKENFLDYDLVERPSKGYVQDLAASTSNQTHKRFILQQASRCFTARSGDPVVQKRPLRRARLFFSPGLKGMLTS
jgi:uncharacterized protein YjbI with pentapeptide repeats